MKSQDVNNIVIALVVVALALGYAVWNRTNPRPLPAGGSVSADERQRVLTPPKPTASDAERRAHFEFVKSKAQTAEALDVTNCNPEPLVFQVRMNQDFRVRNRGMDAKTLVVNPTHVYPVPPQGETVVRANFGAGPGIYGYGCDRNPNTRGMLSVVQ